MAMMSRELEPEGVIRCMDFLMLCRMHWDMHAATNLQRKT